MNTNKQTYIHLRHSLIEQCTEPKGFNKSCFSICYSNDHSMMFFQQHGQLIK